MSKPDQPNQYVCGFFFSPGLSRVALLLKRGGPSHVRNTWTGVGGHIQVGEGIRTAMAREFSEETRGNVDATRWSGFHSMRFRNSAVCHFLAAVAESSTELQSCAIDSVPEPVNVYPTDQVVGLAFRRALGVRESILVFNPELSFLLPLAVNHLRRPLSEQNLGY